MSLRIEKIFGMLSLAILGFLANACVSSVKTPEPVVSTSAAIVEPKAELTNLPIDLEVDAVRQVELMNAQARPTFHVGD